MAMVSVYVTRNGVGAAAARLLQKRLVGEDRQDAIEAKAKRKRRGHGACADVCVWRLRCRLGSRGSEKPLCLNLGGVGSLLRAVRGLLLPARDRTQK